MVRKLQTYSNNKLNLLVLMYKIENTHIAYVLPVYEENSMYI